MMSSLPDAEKSAALRLLESTSPTYSNAPLVTGTLARKITAELLECTREGGPLDFASGRGGLVHGQRLIKHEHEVERYRLNVDGRLASRSSCGSPAAVPSTETDGDPISDAGLRHVEKRYESPNRAPKATAEGRCACLNSESVLMPKRSRISRTSNSPRPSNVSGPVGIVKRPIATVASHPPAPDAPIAIGPPGSPAAVSQPTSTPAHPGARSAGRSRAA